MKTFSVYSDDVVNLHRLHLAVLKALLELFQHGGFSLFENTRVAAPAGSPAENLQVIESRVLASFV